MDAPEKFIIYMNKDPNNPNLSKAPGITAEIYLKYNKVIWDHCDIIRYTNDEKIIDIRVFQDPYWAMKNKKLAIKWVNYFDKTFVYRFFATLSNRKNITMDIIKKAPQEEVNWHVLTRNPAITIRDIEDNPGLPWVVDQITRNPNITYEYIVANSDIIDLSKLSSNNMDMSRDKIAKIKINKY